MILNSETDDIIVEERKWFQNSEKYCAIIAKDQIKK